MHHHMLNTFALPVNTISFTTLVQNYIRNYSNKSTGFNTGVFSNTPSNPQQFTEQIKNLTREKLLKIGHFHNNILNSGLKAP